VVTPIAINFDSVMKSINVLVAGTGQLPPSSEITRYEGVGVGVTSPFRDSVEHSARAVDEVVKTLREELQLSQAAVRQTVADMVAMDASLADEAQVVLTAIDSIMANPLPQQQGPQSPPAAPGVPRAW
jgi:hypothetical protein